MAFTLNAFIELRDAYQIDVLKGIDDRSPEVVMKLTYVAMKHGYRREKKEVDFKLEDVGDWLDLQNIPMIFSEMNKQTAGDRPKVEGAGESPGAESLK